MLPMAIFAQKAPKGKLLSYSHSTANPEIPFYEEFCLSWKDGKGTLTITNHFLTSEYEYTAEASEEVFRQVADSIKKNKLYVAGNKEEPDPKYMPYAYPGREDYSITFENKHIRLNPDDLSGEQSSSFHDLEQFIKDAVHNIKPPSGNLVECSWSRESTVPGMGGEYESLSVQKGKTPVLTVGKSQSTPDGNQETKYIISDEDVQNLRELIIKEKVYKADGFKGTDKSNMASVQRIFLEYDNGAIYQARWSHQSPPAEISKAVKTILEFFTSLTKTSKLLEK